MAGHIGERIRRLRLMTGFGQVELAEKIGVSSGTISMLENGRVPPSAEMIDAIARVVGCQAAYLITDEKVFSVTRPWLRAYADAPKRQIDQQMSDLVTAVEAVDTLDLRRIPDTLPVFIGDLSDDDQIEEFAAEVRAAAQIGEGQVVANAIRAAERLGCLVLPMHEELGRHLGLSARVNLHPVVCVSRSSSTPGEGVDRQRFTLAHELGHLSLHEGAKPPQSAAEAAAIEKQAHLFAAGFLAPADAMADELAALGGRVTLQTLTKIKERWGLSIKALVGRFKTMQIIDADHARSLYKQISARGWNKKEPVFVGGEAAVWFEKAVMKWANATPNSLDLAAASCGLGRQHFDRWTNWSESGSGEGRVISVDFGVETESHRPESQMRSASERQGLRPPPHPVNRGASSGLELLSVLGWP